MSILRRIAIWALLSVFFTSLVLIAYGWTFNETFANRDTVKTWFSESGAYAAFVNEVVAVSQAQAAEDGNVVDGRILADVANESFTPELLQESLESVLDGAYDWLEGNAPEIEFEIDFTEAKQRFAQGLTAVAVERVKGLPVCVTLPGTRAFDPFTAACKPAGFDFAEQSADFEQLIIKDESFLPNPVITASDIRLGDTNNPALFSQAASTVQFGYGVARFGVALAIGMAFLSATGIILIAKSKRKAVFKLFRGFAFTAASLALFTFVTSQSTTWLDSVLSVDVAATGFTERIVKPLVATAADDLTHWTFRFTILYAVIAIIILCAWALLTRKQQKRLKSSNTYTKDKFHKLEKTYKKIVAKKPKMYKKSYTERKEEIKKTKSSK